MATDDTPHDDPRDERDDELIDPAAALALVQRQQSALEREQLGGIPVILLVWGIAWLVGFAALWAGYGGAEAWVTVPLGVAAIVFAALIAAAIGISAWLAMRLNRGVTGPSNFSGAVYGIAWPIVAFSAWLIGVALARNGMEPELQSLFFPAIFALVAGVMYVMGAAIWRSIDQLVLGIIILVAGTAAPFFGAPTNNLVMALLGGGSFLVAGLVMHLNLRRGRRA